MLIVSSTSARRPSRLEPPLERGVLLDVLPVLVERRRADRVQLAAPSIGFSMFDASIDPPSAGADDGVELVDEEESPGPARRDLLEHGLEALLELARYFAPAMSAPMSRATMRLFLSPSGTSPADDRARPRPLDDGGLADAGLADEDRIVLGAARTDLDDAADLLVAADDRIELALARRAR
jgi:hypothetical protein